MVLSQQTELSTAEIDAFLGRHETGVLSLARGNDPYAIPISYGYDGAARRFYVRLVSTPESEKRRFLSTAPQARLVIYEEDDPTYWSVVAEGVLNEIPRDDLTVDHIEQYGDSKRPLFEIWGESTEALDIQLYEFEPETISGRRIRVTR